MPAVFNCLALLCRKSERGRGFEPFNDRRFKTPYCGGAGAGRRLRDFGHRDGYDTEYEQSDNNKQDYANNSP